MDPLLALRQKRERKEEPLVLPPLDPISRLASLLQTVQPVDFFAEHPSGSALAAGYLMQVRKEDIPSYLADDESLGRLAFSEVLKKEGLPGLEAVSMADQVAVLASFWDEQLAAVVVEGKSSDSREQRVEARKEPALLSYWSGQDPEAKLAATLLHQELKEFHEQVAEVGDIPDWIVLQKTMGALEEEAQEEVRALVRNRTPLEEVLIYSWVRTKRKINLDEVRQYRNAIAAWAGTKERLVKESDELRKRAPSEDWWVAQVIEQLRKENIFIELPKNGGKQEQLRKDLAQRVESSWELDRRNPIPYAHDHVVTVKALGEDKYSNRVELERLPLGTLGVIDDDGRFKLPDGRTYILDRAEMAVVRRRSQDRVDEIWEGDAVIVRNSKGAYGVTDDGSWGYVKQKKAGGEVVVDFQLVTGRQPLLPAKFTVDAAHLRKKRAQDRSALEKALERGEKVFAVGDQVWHLQTKRKGEVVSVNRWLDFFPPYTVRLEDGSEGKYRINELRFAVLPQRWKEPPIESREQIEAERKAEQVWSEVEQARAIQAECYDTLRREHASAARKRLETLGVSACVTNAVIYEIYGEKTNPTVWEELAARQPSVASFASALERKIQEGLGVRIEALPIRSWDEYEKSKKGMADRLRHGYQMKGEAWIPAFGTPRASEPDCEVEFVNPVESLWNAAYFADRREQYPIGSKGQLIKKEGNLVWMHVEQEASWKGSWGFEPKVVQFREEEVICLEPPLPEIYKAVWEEAERQLPRILAEQRAEEQQALQPYKQAAQQVVYEWRALGFSSAEIKDLFTKNLSDFSILVRDNILVED